MNNARKWLVAGAAAVAAIAAIGVSASVLAQTPVPGTDSDKSMVDRVAEKLGISSDELSTAIESSAADAIDERVAARELTQERADELKERLAELPDDALIRPGHVLRHGGVGPGVHVFRFHIGEDLAEFLSITGEELRTQMQAEGATLATVAEANGKSRDELKTFLTSEHEAKLAERVAAGDLTQAEADERLAEHAERLDAVIDGELPRFRERRFDGSFEGKPSDGPMDELPFEDEAPNDDPPEDGAPEDEPTTTATDSGIS